MNLLENGSFPSDLKSMESSLLLDLAGEMREFLIDTMAEVGGHVGSNLGVIELAIALHKVFDFEEDRIVWDVSHQSLPHKLLTGRFKEMQKFHKPGGASPFTSPQESPFDQFIVGHTSVAVSLAAGLAKGRDIRGGAENVVAVIGDGALSGGQAFEGLNIAAELNSNLIIVFNDNEMSIDFNYGGLYSGLAELRKTRGESPNNLFKFLGFDYKYLEEGNSIPDLISLLEGVKGSSRPVVLHIHTLKGKGLEPAVKNPDSWHYHVPFDKSTGEAISLVDENRAIVINSADVTNRFILENPDTFAIVAGTPLLGPTLKQQAPSRYFDAGIAEASAVSFGAAIAKSSQGATKPYMAIASCFIERALDQVMQDWLVNATPATLLVFGAGLTNSDASHIGIHDIPMLANLPNLVYLTPTSITEYEKMLAWTKEQSFPTAIRIAGGVIDHNDELEGRAIAEIEGEYSFAAPKPLGHTFTGGIIPSGDFKARSVVEQQGTRVAFLGLGLFFERALQTADLLEARAGFKPTVINPRFISHLDLELLESLKADHSIVVTLEDGIVEGGFGAKVASFFADSDTKVLICGAEKDFVDSVKYGDLMKHYRLEPELILEDILRMGI